ncbi:MULTISPECIES: folate-binding protein YgfZ [unclassified Massilia]|uniref:CAF17-like 4Fe-4S cluster assembly/insertion protein YgfZ n=1 Tax=unclassified Massilia TaxID=2609279 RepID=UPI001B81FA3E|nr:MULTISPECIES: folate-binding protein YgfZ [unclassified Massilia]MBQ5938559.1 folate-binding protein YgfZ [Massilia sp. AB1]MBQ5965941.1 folate-binding protein YgfZ [Massilia sp. ZL223]
MSHWTEQLSALGARFHVDEANQVEDFGRVLTAADLAAGFVAPVTDLGLIAVAGDDAATFLHGQLTNDVEHLGQGDARLAGFCTPKGRLQATFLMWRDQDAVYLQLPRAIQPPLQKRLSMFVLRAKAKLRDATDEAPFQAVLGLGGAKAEAALRRHVATLPTAPMTKVSGEAGTVLRLHDAFGMPRYLWLATSDTGLAALTALKDELALGGNQAWQLAAIHAGSPQVTAATQEQFVPQMVNFELLGGVNFKKGCYPGQEIVARTKYLGKIKRRAALASVENAAARPGDEVFSLADPDQPCGMVVNAAPNGSGGADVLVEIKLAALDEEVRLGSSAGPRLAFAPLPYSLDAVDD